MAAALDIAGEIFGGHNPLTNEEKSADRLHEDTNAVVCPDYFVRARGLLGATDGVGSTLLGALRCVGPAAVAFFLAALPTIINDPANLSGLEVYLLVIFFTASPFILALTKVTQELFAVLRPDGELARLGLGDTKVSVSALATLEKQRKLTRLVQAFSVGVGTLFAAPSGIFMIVMAMGMGRATIAQGATISTTLLLAAVFLVVTVPLACEFALSLQVAAALTSDSVLEVVHAVNSVSPVDDTQWNGRVVQPSLELANGPVALLSRGWGGGLALLYIGLWSLSLGLVFSFSQQLVMISAYFSPFRFNGLLLTTAAVLLLLGMPMAISVAVAQVSTSCDDLGDSINQRRIEDLDRSPRLLALELALQNLNNRQGLGFLVFDTVLDKKRLRSIYTAVGGLFATLVPVILAFNSGSSAAVTYGAFAHSETVYAYNSMGRSAAVTEIFCEKLWMFPASLDPSTVSEEELIQVLRGITQTSSVSVMPGAKRGTEPGTLVWTDGTPWTRQTDDIEDIDTDEPYLYLELDDEDKLSWRMSDSTRAPLCKGRLSDIKGATPTIANLARSQATKASCGLTSLEREMIQTLMQRNTTCVYNMTLSSIIES
jgi:hypothetical protein